MPATRTAPTPAGLDPSFRRVLVIAMLPTLAASIGMGAVVPIIPSAVRALGGGLESAAFIAGAVVLGGILGDLPAGALVARIGERRSMLVAAVGSIIGVVLGAIAPTEWQILAGVLLIGVCSATFALARHAYLTLAVPVKYRARTLSTLGGVFRAGAFVGPFIAAAIISATGSPQAVFWAALVAELVAIAVLLLAPDPEEMAPAPGAALATEGPGSPGRAATVASAAVGERMPGEAAPGGAVVGTAAPGAQIAAEAQAAAASAGLVPSVTSEGATSAAHGPTDAVAAAAEAEGVVGQATLDEAQPVPGDPRSSELLEDLEAEEPGGIFAEMRRSRAVLARLGTTVGIVALLRTARQVLLPVWGLSIGMSDADVALVMGISGGLDFALFFASGWIMDRWGRAASGVPALAGLTLGFGALALTHDLASAQAWFVAVAIVIGLANGIGSGIIMTLGADAAPPERPAPFLAAWHFITDLATGVVPFLVSGLAAVAGLPAVAASLAAIGVAGTGLMACYAPRYGPKRE
ncbi:hypothetical protein USB125703_00522 [Pseudoclavibacter triregionum]|nr:hypothetical protein USB125703_00522 [Pseudoclavibacter triregionum]